MTLADFVEEVSRLGGFTQKREAKRAITATLSVLGERLAPSEARLLAEDLPDELGRVLRRAVYAGDFELRELYERVARREKVRLGFGMEHTQVVCEVMAKCLSGTVVRHLREQLPVPIASLFVIHDRRPSAPASAHASEEGETLATGRPGSRRPVSEGREP